METKNEFNKTRNAKLINLFLQNNITTMKKNLQKEQYLLSKEYVNLTISDVKEYYESGNTIENYI